MLAAILAGRPGVVASHRSAAWLFGLPGFRVGRVELTIQAVTVPRRPSEHRIHRTSHLPPAHVRLVDGISCTSVARTLFDLSGGVHPSRAERAVDNAIARRLVTVAALWRVLDDLAEPARH